MESKGVMVHALSFALPDGVEYFQMEAPRPLHDKWFCSLFIYAGDDSWECQGEGYGSSPQMAYEAATQDYQDNQL